jgi:hypothetical protein
VNEEEQALSGRPDFLRHVGLICDLLLLDSVSRVYDEA